MPVVDFSGATVLAPNPAWCHRPFGQPHPRRDQIVVDFGVGGDIPHRAIHRGVHRIPARPVLPQHVPDLMAQHRPARRDAPPLRGAQHLRIDVKPPIP